MFFSVDKRLGDDNVSINKLADSLKKSFELVKGEFDEHLEAINDNTTEQQIQNNDICEMDGRLTKIEERMDEIHYMLQRIITKADFSVDLTKDEQRVFLSLYTSDTFVTPNDIAVKMAVPRGVVEDALDAMMDKAVPIQREMIEGKLFFRMTKEFKLRQAKESIIKIDADVTQQYQNTLLHQFFEA